MDSDGELSTKYFVRGRENQPLHRVLNPWLYTRSIPDSPGNCVLPFFVARSGGTFLRQALRVALPGISSSTAGPYQSASAYALHVRYMWLYLYLKSYSPILPHSPTIVPSSSPITKWVAPPPRKDGIQGHSSPVLVCDFVISVKDLFL